MGEGAMIADAMPPRGLRERKKAKTKAAIQHHALWLFQQQGYDATTIEQIAEAADISPSTFFRYFPTKEDVVMWDDLDPRIIAAFEAQPTEWGPIPALRSALREVFAGLPAEVAAQQRERARLIIAVPELRMRMLDQFASMIELIAQLVARRIGRRADEFAVRTFAGAVVGVLLAALFASVENLQADYADYIALIDASLAHLEAGLPL